ncbi:MAG: 50S ribosomal protein L11 methyltransferase [Parachlamydiaceae bacterium]|nr:50S ribosomal protein L11 methyltransferase [Parachlamydiaceae bacterium]
MNEIAFFLKPQTDSDEAWQQLEDAGCHLLYSSEEENGAQVIFGRIPHHLKNTEVAKLCPAVDKIEAAPFPPIDWEAQWASHGSDYHDGFVHLKLSDYADDLLSTLKLKPGPGFGDLSHPTTRLVLTLMPALVKNKLVIDIGCGSGILSLAAIAMGAKAVVGIDIDAEAVNHARQNADLNDMTKNIQFFLPEDYLPNEINPLEEVVVLMNMIQSEQQTAWMSLKNIHINAHTMITSGILAEGLESYLQQCQSWKWEQVNKIECDGWLGFRLKKSRH